MVNVILTGKTTVQVGELFAVTILVQIRTIQLVAVNKELLQWLSIPHNLINLARDELGLGFAPNNVSW
jgi:hypothetical protein